MNRRRYYRFSVNLEVKYRILESLKDYQGSLTEDMCEEGIRINLPEFIKPDTRLELVVKIPGESRPLAAIGRVAWIKKAVLSDFYTAGINFLHINARNKERFYKYALL